MNGGLFSTLIALGVGVVLIGLLVGAALVLAGAVIAVWFVFMLAYWAAAIINFARERGKAR